MKKRIAGLDEFSLKTLGCDGNKILKSVNDCILAMSELTIKESQIARKHLDSVMEEMYRRSPDTVIGTIQRPL